MKTELSFLSPHLIIWGSSWLFKLVSEVDMSSKGQKNLPDSLTAHLNKQWEKYLRDFQNGRTFKMGPLYICC